MKKLIFTISIILFAIFTLSAQNWTDKLDKDKLQKGQLTLLDYEKAFDDYWGPYNVVNGYYYVDGKKTKAPGWKLFKRWVWKMEFYCDAEGNFPTTSTSEELQKYYKNNPNASKSPSGNWSNVGYNATPGGYQGVGRINTVAFHPTDNNTFWTGSASGGMWKTTDGGSNWTVLTDALEVMGVSAIGIPSDYVTSTTIYLGTGDRDGNNLSGLGGGTSHDSEGVGVLKSTDGGSTWNTTGLSFAQSQLRVINDLLILPSDDNTIYAATNAGLYKTTDGGTTWPLLFADDFIDLEFKPGDPTIMYGAKKDFDEDGNVYRSTNGGASFTAIALPGSSSQRTELAVSANDATVVYALTVNSSEGLEGIYKSTNSGVSFSLTFDGSTAGNNLLGYECDGTTNDGQGTYDVFLTANPNNVDDVYAGGINIWRTTNGGSSWSLKSHWTTSACGGTVNTVHADQHSCDFQDGSTIFIGNDGGIYKSTDNGSNWTDLSNGLTINQIYRIGVSQQSSDEVIIGLQDNGTHLYTGATWVANGVLGGDGMECIIDPTNDNVQFGESPEGDINRSADHWTDWWTWVEVRENIRDATGATGNESGTWVTPYMLDPNDHNNLFVGYEELWKSTDQGVTSTNFSKISTFGGGDDYIKALQIAPSNSNYIYVGFEHTLYRTTIGGTTWSDITGTLPIASNQLTYIAVKDDDENTVWVSIGGFNGDAVYETTDGGTNWTNISAGLPQLPAMSIIQNTQNTAVTELYVSMSGGVWVKYATADWIPFNTNFISVFCSELDIYYDNTTPANSKIRVGTFGRGLWESDLFELPAPVADFEADNTLPADNTVSVTFTDQSSNFPTSWLWTITPATHTYQGGTSSTSQNPIVTFNSTGAYTIALKATNAQGFDTETKTDYIHQGTPGLWTGTSDDEWNTTSNWHNQMIPVSTTDVTIPTGAANFPFFVGNFTIGTQCNQITMEDVTDFIVSGDLTIASGKALNCADDAIIYIGGDWTNNGTFNPSTGTVDFYGTNPSTINVKPESTVYLIDDDISTWPGNWNGDIGTWTGGTGSGMFEQQFTANAGGTSPEAGFEYIDLNPGTRRFYYNPVNTSDLTSLTLDFNHMVDDYDGWEGYTVKVEYSTDGTNWSPSDWSDSPTGNIAATEVSTTLTTAHGVGAANYYISFTITGDLYNLYYWYIDDVKLSYTVPPAETFYNLTISKEFAEATTNGNGTINVDNDLTLLSGSWLTNATGNTLDVTGDFILDSDDTGDASFVNNGTLGFGSKGEAKARRYISPWTDDDHGWHFLASPVAAQAIQTGFVPNPPTADEDFYKWDELSGLWISTKLENGSWNTGFGNDFTVGAAYLVAYKFIQTKTFAGTLNNADVGKTGLTYTPASSHTGWNLLGNPFPCALQWNQNAAWNLSNIDGISKTWKESSASYTDIPAGGIIPSMQGFMVHVTAAGTGSLTIPASDRTHSSTAWYKEGEVNKINLTAYDIQGNTAQESIIGFNQNATTGYDSEFDSHFLAGYAPMFYSVSGDENLSTNTLPEVGGELEIPLGFIKNASTSFYIEAEGINSLVPQENVYLADLKLNITRKLNDNPIYHFVAADGDNPSRFKLQFGAVGINEMPEHNISVYPANGNIIVHFDEPGKATVRVYNITGQLVKSTTADNTHICTINMDFSIGAFIVEISTSEFIISKKVILY